MVIIGIMGILNKTAIFIGNRLKLVSNFSFKFLSKNEIVLVVTQKNNF